MTPFTNNIRRRVERAALSLNAHTTAGTEPPETVITDMLSDLQHYCEFHGLDFDALQSMARIHYHEESSQERNDNSV